MFLKLPFAVSFSVLFITIQYAVFRKSLSVINISMHLIGYIHTCVDMKGYVIYIYIYILIINRLPLRKTKGVVENFSFRATSSSILD